MSHRGWRRAQPTCMRTNATRPWLNGFPSCRMTSFAAPTRGTSATPRNVSGNWLRRARHWPRAFQRSEQGLRPLPQGRHDNVALAVIDMRISYLVDTAHTWTVANDKRDQVHFFGIRTWPFALVALHQRAWSGRRCCGLACLPQPGVGIPALYRMGLSLPRSEFGIGRRRTLALRLHKTIVTRATAGGLHIVRPRFFAGGKHRAQQWSRCWKILRQHRVGGVPACLEHGL